MKLRYYRLTDTGRKHVSDSFNDMGKNTDEFDVLRTIYETKASSIDILASVVGDKSRAMRAIRVLRRKKLVEEVG